MILAGTLLLSNLSSYENKSSEEKVQTDEFGNKLV